MTRASANPISWVWPCSPAASRDKTRLQAFHIAKLNPREFPLVISQETHVNLLESSNPWSLAASDWWGTGYHHRTKPAFMASTENPTPDSEFPMLDSQIMGYIWSIRTLLSCIFVARESSMVGRNGLRFWPISPGLYQPPKVIRLSAAHLIHSSHNAQPIRPLKARARCHHETHQLPPSGR